MAIVDINRLIPTMFAKAFDYLRCNVNILKLVNQDFSPNPASRGDVITIPKHTGATVSDVVPSAVSPGGDNIQAETVQLKLDEWKKTSFSMTEDEAVKIYNVEGYLPGRVKASIAAITEHINAALSAKYVDIYNFTSDAAFNATHINPFATSENADAAVNARSILNRHKAPTNPRYLVMNQFAEDNALKNKLFINGDYGGFDALRTGQIREKYGFLWAMDQQMPDHTAGTASTAADITVNANAAIDVTTVSMAKGAGSATVVIGDVFKFANDTLTTYVATAAVSISTGQTVTFQPSLKKAVTASTAVTFTKSHSIAGLAFHPEAMTIAFREVKNASVVTNGRQITMTDDLTGIPLRLTFSPEHFQESWYFDVLYGLAVPRPELACRIAGAMPV